MSNNGGGEGGGGGGGNNQNNNNNDIAKVVEIKPHPVMEQLPGVQYCINSAPPWGQCIILGFQHYILTLGSTVLIPSMLVHQMGGGNVEKAKLIQTLLFVSGINTLLQSFFGTRLPSVISGSFSYLIPMTSIIYSKRFQPSDGLVGDYPDYQRFERTVRAMQGALMVASGFQIIIGFSGVWRNIIRCLNTKALILVFWSYSISADSSINKIRYESVDLGNLELVPIVNEKTLAFLDRFFTPLSMVPLMTFTGLGLYYLGFPLLAKCVEVGLPQLILIIFLSQYLSQCRWKNKTIISDKYAILISVPFVWLYAQLLTSCGAYGKVTNDDGTIDQSGLIGGSPWVYLPHPFQWGRPTVEAGEAIAVLVASFVASIESTGSFLVAARYGSATPTPPSVLGRGVLWMGFGTFLSGMFGTVTGCTASVENAGLLALTKVGSRRVVQISAVFMILFSIIGKFGAFFASIPMPIMAALHCFFFGYAASAGIGLLQFCNLNSYRTKSILGFSFSLGLSIPQFFREYQLSHGKGPVQTHAQWFNDMIIVIFTSHALVAAIVAVLLDCTLHREEDGARKNSGSQWWEKFVEYNTDLRSHDFYKLPFRLSHYFPSY